MGRKDGRVVARENELRVLRALHRYGWLRTRDIAALVWQRWAANAPVEGPHLQPPAPTAAGLRMAQKTLARLRDTPRRVVSSKAPDGSLIYALSENGARILQRLGVAAGTGKDQVRKFSSSHFKHSCIANQIAISAIIEGFRVSTEREIAQGTWMGGELGIAGKRPDVLLRNGATIWWVEVERSRKNSRDYARLLSWLEVVRRDALAPAGSKLLGEKQSWAKVIFICRPVFRAKLARDLEAMGWGKKQISTYLTFETSLYRFEDIAFN